MDKKRGKAEKSNENIISFKVYHQQAYAFGARIIKYRKYIYRMIREGFNEMSSQVKGFRNSDGTEENYMVNILLRVATWASRGNHNVFSKQAIICVKRYRIISTLKRFF